MKKSDDLIIPIRSRIACKHAAIADELTERIRTGRLSGKLPGVTRLAEEFAVNPLTICKALDTLEERALIERRPRIGTFVKYKKRIGVFFLTRNRFGAANGPARRQPLLPALYNIVTEGVGAVIDECQFTMLVQAVNPDDAAYLQYLKREVDGAVILHAGVGVTDDDLDVFADIPFVRAMGKPLGNRNFWHVSYDNGKTALLAADYLRQAGCEAAIYVGATNTELAGERYRRFTEAMAELPVELFNLDIVDRLTMPQYIEQGIQRMRPVLEALKDRRIGVFLASDVFVAPIYHILRSFQREPMRDLPVVSCDNNYYFLHGIYPAPAEIDIQSFEIGRRSANLLLRLMDGPGEPPSSRELMVEPCLLPPPDVNFSEK